MQKQVTQIVNKYSQLVCPVCGFDYTHVWSVDFDPHGGRDPNDASIEIKFYCENDHSWYLRIREARGHPELSFGELKEPIPWMSEPKPVLTPQN
jgi:hypothetical protein